MEDTLQTISLPEPLLKDKFKDKSILYRPTPNVDQTTIPKSNDAAEPRTKDTEQLPTPSRTVSPDLPESNASPQGLQDDIMDTIKESPNQPSSSPEPPNRATNTAPRANEVSAKPSADLILPEGSKRIRR